MTQLKTINLISLLIIFFSFSCSDKNITEFDNQELKVNKFTNSELQKVINFQNERNTKALLNFFKHPDFICREAAILAMASIQDTMALNNLIDVLLNEKSIKIRMAAAFSIGQTGGKLAEKSLLEAFQTEKSEKVKFKILESIGKCGSDTGLVFLSNIVATVRDSIILNGALLGIARFSLRNIFTIQSIEEIISIFREKRYSESTKYYASIAFVRMKDFDSSPYLNDKLYFLCRLPYQYQ